MMVGYESALSYIPCASPFKTPYAPPLSQWPSSTFPGTICWKGKQSKVNLLLESSGCQPKPAGFVIVANYEINGLPHIAELSLAQSDKNVKKTILTAYSNDVHFL